MSRWVLVSAAGALSGSAPVLPKQDVRIKEVS
jgi:hypothetical protein